MSGIYYGSIPECLAFTKEIYLDVWYVLRKYTWMSGIILVYTWMSGIMLVYLDVWYVQRKYTWMSGIMLVYLDGWYNC